MKITPLHSLFPALVLLAILGSFAWSFGANAAFNGNLTVEINGLKNKQGQVCINVFANSQGFPGNGDRIFKKQCNKITETPFKVTFENLKAGSYAVAVIHDQNNDRTINLNNFGIPIEGFGFSRNPEVRIGPPKFGEAAFLVAGTNTNIQIQLKYF